MASPTRKMEVLVWTTLGLVIASLVLAFILANLRLRMALGKPLPIIGPVADFSLTNQNSKAVSLKDLQGQPWVADVIFTRCPGPCLKMSGHMKELQEALAPERKVRLVSLTTDPDYDRPAVLEKYGANFGQNPNRWIFLTGEKEEIQKLARSSLKLAAKAKEPGEREAANDLYVHSTIFVLVDKHARLRGVYETMGEGVDFALMKKEILASLRRLEREP
jgi:cytochrome oxidase Cu insertion factor (SCO1/SenC/PrrC family)